MPSGYCRQQIDSMDNPHHTIGAIIGEHQFASVRLSVTLEIKPQSLKLTTSRWAKGYALLFPALAKDIEIDKKEIIRLYRKKRLLAFQTLLIEHRNKTAPKYISLGRLLYMKQIYADLIKQGYTLQ